MKFAFSIAEFHTSWKKHLDKTLHLLQKSILKFSPLAVFLLLLNWNTFLSASLFEDNWMGKEIFSHSELFEKIWIRAKFIHSRRLVHLRIWNSEKILLSKEFPSKVLFYNSKGHFNLTHVSNTLYSLFEELIYD